MKAMIAALTAALSFGLAGMAVAKMPAPPPMNDEQKAKAEEAKAKAAETAKKDAEALAKSQDRAAENYKKQKGIATASTAPTAKAAPKK